MSKLYLLMCTTVNSNDDLEEIPIRAFTNLEVVKQHEEKANKYSQEFAKQGNTRNMEYKKSYANPYDPICTRYLYQHYWYTEVEVFI